MLLSMGMLAGCVPAGHRASWRVYPLPRHRPHDGLAVVTRPGGLGLHIWLDTDTSRRGVCRPRWNPDAARLQAGNSRSPSSFGRAPREEFFEAMGRGRVRWALRRQFRALCRDRAPRSRFVWVEPPRSAEAFQPQPVPLLEERHLLSHPKAVLRQEKRLLGIPLEPEDFDEKDAMSSPAPGP